MAGSSDLDQIIKALNERKRADESWASAIQRRSEALETRTKKLSDILSSLSASVGSSGADLAKRIKDLSQVADKMTKVSDNVNVTNAQLEKLRVKSLKDMKDVFDRLGAIQPQMKDTLDAMSDSEQSFADVKESVDSLSSSVRQYRKIQESLGDTSDDMRRSLLRLGFTTEQAAKKVEDAKKTEFKRLLNEAKLAGKFRNLGPKGAARDAALAELMEKLRRKAEINASGIISAQSDVAGKAKELADAFEEVIVTIGKNSQQLQDKMGTVGQVFKKFASDSGGFFTGYLKRMATLGYGISKLVDGVKQGYDEFVKLNSLGLAGMFGSLQASVLKYQISMDTLTKIVSENRVAMFREALDTGRTFEQSQGAFLERVTKLANEEGITDRLGKNKGAEAAADIVSSVRFGGVMDPEQQEKTAKKLAQDWTKVHTVFGVSAEEFKNSINAIRDMEGSQIRLIAANKAQRAAILEANSEIYRQGKFLGLSNAQIEEEIRAREDATNPFKTALKDYLQKQFIAPKIAGAMMGQILGKEKGEQFAAATQRLNQIELELGRTDLNKDQVKKLREEQAALQLTQGTLRAEAVQTAKTDLANNPTAVGALVAGNLAAPHLANLGQQIEGSAAVAAAAAAGKNVPEGAQTDKLAKEAGVSSLQKVQTGVESASNLLHSAGGALIAAAASLAAAAALQIAAAKGLGGLGKILGGLGGAAKSIGGAAKSIGGILTKIPKGVVGKLGLGGAVAAGALGAFELFGDDEEGDKKKEKTDTSEKVEKVNEAKEEEKTRRQGEIIGEVAGSIIGGVAGAFGGPLASIATSAVLGYAGGKVGGWIGSKVGGSSDKRKQEPVPEAKSGAVAPTKDIVTPTNEPPKGGKGPEMIGWTKDAVQKEYMRRGYPEKQAEVLATGAAAQLALETGWEGRSAQGKNNFFNIKETRTQKGDVPGKGAVDRATGSYDIYAGYSTPEKGIAEYVDFLHRNPRYKKAGLFNVTTPEEYAAAIQRSGFAEDPKYAKKLTDVMGGPRMKTAIASYKGRSAPVEKTTVAETKPIATSVAISKAVPAPVEKTTVAETKPIATSVAISKATPTKVASTDVPQKKPGEMPISAMGPAFTASALIPTGPTIPIIPSVTTPIQVAATSPKLTPITEPTKVAVTTATPVTQNDEPGTSIISPMEGSDENINTNEEVVKTINESNTYLARISSGIDRLLVVSANTGKVGTTLTKIPKNSSEAYKA